MARRWADPAAFRVDPRAVPALRPTRRQSVALLAVLVLVAGTVAAVSYLIRPERARAFDLLHGSVLVGDQFGPVNIDLASGRGTLQLRGADAQVGISGSQRMAIVPFQTGTLLLNDTTGEFNMVDSTGFVIKRNGGVTLGGVSGATSATGVAAGQYAYIERSGPGGSDVLLVGPSTVALAAASASAVKARATYSTTDVGSTDAAGSASANGDFWAVFTRAGGTRTVRQLSLPPNSSTGAMLTSTEHGTVGPIVALESATVAANGSGGDVVGVATPGKIQLFPHGGPARTLRYPAPAGLDKIVPATNAEGRLVYLLHSSSGWSVLSVDTDGRDLTGPHVLSTIDPSARLATPAQSLGSVYTMLQSGSAGSIYRITPTGKVTAVAAAYPQKMKDGRSVETAPFDDGYLIARGSRVIVDSPGHYLALTVFTDGSHAPVVVEKTKLISVDAAGGAEALTKGISTDNDTPPAKSSTKPKVAAAPTINNKINCKQVTQKPHVPVISGATPSARTVGLSWTYPIYDNSDCQPSTYIVSVKLISNTAPPAPGSVTLQGVTDTIVGGLYPNTTYAFTVTAFINGQGTSSVTRQITTTKEGPAAPDGVSVTADNSGNWELSWRGCGAISQTCVPADSWSVIPAFCDGLGLSASPPPLSVPADPTSITQPPTVFKGSDDLLGRSLQFRVQGMGLDGAPGTASAPTACVQSWTPPVLSEIHVTASQPPQTSTASESSSTDVSVSFDQGAAHALGGVGGTLTYQLLLGGSVVTTSGPTTATTAHLDGIKPGLSYQVSVIATPPGHPEAAATTAPVAVTQATSAWPTITAAVTSVNNTGLTTADVTLQLSGLSSADAGGERFDIDYQLQCGSSGPPPGTFHAVDPSQPLTLPSVNRLVYNGSNCSIQVTRVQESGGSGVFGGTPAPAHPTTPQFSIDPPQLGTVSQSDFKAAWDGTSGGLSQVNVQYTGSDPVIGLGLGSWTVTIASPSTTDCISGGGPYTGHSLGDISINQSCVDADGSSGSNWTVAISYKPLVGSATDPVTVGIDGGAAPTQPVCNVTAAGLGAAWSGTKAAPTITVSVNDASQIANCTGWSLTVVAPATATCGTSDSAPPQTLTPTCADTPASTGWSVTVGYTDLTKSAQSVSLPITNEPPG